MDVSTWRIFVTAAAILAALLVLAAVGRANRSCGVMIAEYEQRLRAAREQAARSQDDDHTPPAATGRRDVPP